MRVHKNGSVHVSANAYVPDYRIDAFVIKNIPFIERARYKSDTLNAKWLYGSSKWRYPPRKLCANDD